MSTDVHGLCGACDAEGEYQGDTPTNFGPTATDPGYVELWECPSCGNAWTV